MKNLYIKTTWVDNATPVNAANLNKIENAITDLYQNALSVSDFAKGSGIDLNITTDKKLEISVTKDLMRSNSCSGIEMVTEEPSEIVESVLYFVVDPETKKLKKIIINGLAIYEVE